MNKTWSALAVTFLITTALPAFLAKAHARVLTLEDIVAAARSQSPPVRMAAGRLQEAKATMVGTHLPATTNPLLTLTAGPGYPNPPKADLEFMLTLQWPLDFTFARTGRSTVAQQMVRQATANYEEAMREQTALAVALAVRMAVAQEKMQLSKQRCALDENLFRIAQIRETAGTGGAADVALAQVTWAQSQVLVSDASAENSNVALNLAFTLGLPTDADLTLPCDFLLPLTLRDDNAAYQNPTDLVATIDTRPDARRARAGQAAAQADVHLQKALGMPIPSVLLSAGRGPEYQLSGGVTVPIPVYQRNQTSRAVSMAHAETTRLAAHIAMQAAEAQIRALYINHRSAHQKFKIMAGVCDDISRAEHLALRGFELGQDNLSQVLISRRETVQARTIYLESKAAAAQAYLALQIASGAFDG